MSTAAGHKLATKVILLRNRSHQVLPCISHVRLYSSRSSFHDGLVDPLLEQRPLLASSSTDVTMRYMSNNKPKKKGAKNKEKEEELSWDEKKMKAKEYRRSLHEKKVARQESLKTRRDGKTLRGSRRDVFRTWFEPLRQKQRFEDREARRLNLPWKIRVAAIIERLPVVLPDKPQWEQEYMDLRGYLNTFGKVYPKELGFMPDDYQEVAGNPTTEEDLLALLPEGLKPAPRETEADKTGDVKTLDRKLKERVYLAILPHSNDGDSSWTFPTVTNEEGETLLDSAKRAIKQNCDTLDLICMSNCPLAVDTIAYPKDKREQYYGEKIFYIKVQRDDGDVNPDKILHKNQDYAWLAREEMADRVRQQNGENAGSFFHFLL